MFFRAALIMTVASLFMVSTLLATTNPNSSTTIQKMNQMPLSFTKNMGQWDDRVLFCASAGGATMWFTKEGVTYQLTRRVDNRNLIDSRGTLHVPAGTRSVPLQEDLDSRLRGNDREGVNDKEGGNDTENDGIEQLVLTAEFVGANPNSEVIAERLMEYKCNYFLGNDPAKWYTDVPNYETITLKDIYPGIDVKYSGDGTGQAAYEFVVASGADIAQVKVEYDGAEKTSIDADGRMILKTKWGDMIGTMKTPTGGIMSGVASFSPLSEKTIGFTAQNAGSRALGTQAVQLSYSTYLGGGNYDYGEGIAVDGSGNAYVVGVTSSSNFPVQHPYMTAQGSYDLFVSRLASSGNSLVYSTYLGGSGYDWGWDIAVDGGGNAYVTGVTASSDFPVLNHYQTYQGASDVFVANLASSGYLIYSTYLGGGAYDRGEGIAVDGAGYAYITGYTQSRDFPLFSAYQTDQDTTDAFVTKLSTSGSSLVYSTYLGGDDRDYGYSITVDESRKAYVTGETRSSNFPTLNPYQTDQGGVDVFITKFSNVGNSVVYSTYLGGTDSETGVGIAVDGSGNAAVIGRTRSADFPTYHPYQTAQGGQDAFVTKLSSAGNTLIYSTYLGGTGEDEGRDIAVDGSGNACVTGITLGTDFPTLDSYQTYQGMVDAFVTELSSDGNSLIYSTYLGGINDDHGMTLAIDAGGNAYVTGYTGSANFPTLNPYQATFMGGTYDAFVTKLGLPPAYLCGDANGDDVVDISDAVYLIAYIFSGGSAPSPLLAGDANCDGTVDISDVVYLIAYIFSGGQAPCAGCK